MTSDFRVGRGSKKPPKYRTLQDEKSSYQTWQVGRSKMTSDVIYGRSLSHILVNLHNATVASRLSKTEPNENATKFINPLTTLLLGQELQLSVMYSTFVYIVLLLYDKEYVAIELRTRQTLLQAPSLSYQLLVIHMYTVLLFFKLQLCSM